MNDLGTVTLTGTHAILTFERRLAFPIDRVWAAITDPDERGAWLGTTHHEWRQRIVEDSVVRYELTADGDATLLTFTHTGLSERNALGFAPGTHAFLDRLRAHLDAGSLPNWGERYAPAYPAWRDAS